MRTILLTILLCCVFPVSAGGTLKAVMSNDQTPLIQSHRINVVINNGFARTEVEQVFSNPNEHAIEAIYAVPVPQSAALSELSIFLGDMELQGEVLERDKAEELYQKEREQGRDAGIASKDAFDTFHFRVSPVPSMGESRFRYVYYQPIDIDTSVGRYVYPLEEGGTDEVAEQFWTRNEHVSGVFEFDLLIKSSWPISSIRIPGFSDAVQSKGNDGSHHIQIKRSEHDLTSDIVVYYQLEENLPSRVEFLAYRPEASADGTFMMVVTPGLDLKELNQGADYVFVLDYSGSMQDKLSTMQRGIEQTLGKMNSNDRFRIVRFGNQASELIGWTQASPKQIESAMSRLSKSSTIGGTNIYEGLSMGLEKLDQDRVTSLILVTDGVANVGLVEPQAFHQLMTTVDIRVFGFLMGNNSNWPLMRTITQASGGFYKGVSNSDDIVGQVLLAKSKITHECLHDASLEIKGINTYGVNNEFLNKVYRGQQLVFFGRYTKPGQARISLKARLSGADKTYQTEFDFPEVAVDHPELERLWALMRIEHAEDMHNAGLMDEAESESLVKALGLEFQLVTDETSMVVMGDDQFEQYGIDRNNRNRVMLERQAQLTRSQAPIVSPRVDRKKPMFDLPAPSLGGGALDPIHLLLAVVLALGVFIHLRQKS